MMKCKKGDVQRWNGPLFRLLVIVMLATSPDSGAFELKNSKYNIITVAVIPFVDNTSSSLGQIAQGQVEDILKRRIRRFNVTPTFKMRTIINENKLFVGEDRTIDLVALQGVSAEHGIDLFIIANVIEVGDSFTILFRFIFGKSLEELPNQRIKISKVFDEAELGGQIENIIRTCIAQLPYHGVVTEATDPNNISIQLGKMYTVRPGAKIEIIEILGVAQHPIHQHIVSFDTRVITTISVKEVRGDYVVAVNADALAVEKNDLARLLSPVESSGEVIDEPIAPKANSMDILPGEEPKQDQSADSAQMQDEPLSNKDPLADEVNLDDALVEGEEDRQQENKEKTFDRGRSLEIGPKLGASIYKYTIADGSPDPQGYFPYVIPLNFFTVAGIDFSLDLGAYFQLQFDYLFGFFSTNVKVERRGNISGLFININDLKTAGVVRYPIAMAGDYLDLGLRLGYAYHSIVLGKVNWYEGSGKEPIYILPMTIHSPIVGLLVVLPLGSAAYKVELGMDYWAYPSFEEDPQASGPNPSSTAMDFSALLKFAVGDSISLKLGYEGNLFSTKFNGPGRHFERDLNNAKIDQIYNTIIAEGLLQF